MQTKRQVRKTATAGDEGFEPVALRRDRERFAALQRALGELGLFRRGSLTRVYVRCGKKECGCMTDARRRHGPYVQWTRKVAGKTVSRRLLPEQVPLFEEWLANSRRLDHLLAEMQAVSMRATEALLRQRIAPARQRKGRSDTPGLG
jgi:hypothetical protein